MENDQIFCNMSLGYIEFCPVTALQNMAGRESIFIAKLVQDYALERGCFGKNLWVR